MVEERGGGGVPRESEEDVFREAELLRRVGCHLIEDGEDVALVGGPGVGVRGLGKHLADAVGGEVLMVGELGEVVEVSPACGLGGVEGTFWLRLGVRGWFTMFWEERLTIREGRHIRRAVCCRERVDNIIEIWTADVVEV